MGDDFASRVPGPLPLNWRHVLFGVLAGVACIAVAYLATRMIGSAWSECYDIDAGARFALVFGIFPLAVIGTGLLGACAALLTLRLHPAIRVVAALVAVIVLALVADTVIVLGGRAATPWTHVRAAR